MRMYRKVLLLLFLVLLISISLEADSKQIIVGTYSHMSEAEADLREFQLGEQSEKLNALAKQNNFKIHLLPSGSETILVIEPIENPVVYIEIIRILKAKLEARSKTETEIDLEIELDKAAEVSASQKDENQTQTLDIKEKVFSEVVPPHMQQVNKKVLPSDAEDILQQFKEKGFKWDYSGTLQGGLKKATVTGTLEDEHFEEIEAVEEVVRPKKYQLSQEELRLKEEASLAAKKERELQEKNQETMLSKEQMRQKTKNELFSVLEVVGYYWLFLLTLALAIGVYYFKEYRLIFTQK